MAGEQNKSTFAGSIMRGDSKIWFIYVVLICISFVEIFSATAQLANKAANASDPAFNHIKNLLVGFIILLLTQSMSLKSFRAWDKTLYVLGLIFFIITIAMGTQQKGAARSIAGFQPVELCKLGAITMLCAAVTAKDYTYQRLSYFRSRTRYRRYLLYMIIIGLIALPVATQNLSSALIICMACFGILFLAGVRGKYLLNTILVGAVAGGIFIGSLYIVYKTNHSDNEVVQVDGNGADSGGFTIDKVLGRATTWANRLFEHSSVPLWQEDMSGKKSQEIYSHMAIANGYPFGQFIGRSRLRDFLPEAFSDYIFAIIFEEWGFILASLIPLLYLLLLARCYYLSRQTESQYIRLIIVGLPLIMVIQALIHIGVSTGAMFVTGQPLPLISRGGSSIMATSASFGMILALSRLIVQEKLEREAPEAIALNREEATELETESTQEEMAEENPLTVIAERTQGVESIEQKQ